MFGNIKLFLVIIIGLFLFPDKNRAVDSNAFRDNHTCEIIDFINGGKINKHFERRPFVRGKQKIYVIHSPPQKLYEIIP